MNINNVKKIVEERDKYQLHSHQWLELNTLKNHALSINKPSTNEVILYFEESDLTDLPLGFSKPNNNLKFYNLPQEFASRFTLEHGAGITRHPIPYIIIKYDDKYFYIVREQGSGESRLIGKVGLVGGHVGIEDKESTAIGTIVNGMYRELEEEVGIKPYMISNIEFKGFIKSNDGVDQDHLGVIYEIKLFNNSIKAEEVGVLSGVWINKTDLPQWVDKMENWSKIVYENIIKDN